MLTVYVQLPPADFRQAQLHSDRLDNEFSETSIFRFGFLLYCHEYGCNFN